MKKRLRELPPVHELQRSEQFLRLLKSSGISTQRLIGVIREEVDRLRTQFLEGSDPIDKEKETVADYLWEQIKEKTNHLSRDRITRLINGTGTVLHTNLGRARLSKEAIEHIMRTAGGYSDLEYDLETGKRGSRHDVIEDLLTACTGAEAAMVVNNNAAAVYLILRALAKNKEVIVSRGELVEIGGSFRVSSIMEESGAKLVEVGTTNKTHEYDYEHAITEETGMIMKVHTSNFKTIGFTESVSTKELVRIKHGSEDVLFYEDLGSGSLFDFRKHQIGDEPLVREVIENGADLVSFSGDKLLGGPQAGIIVGKKELVERLKKHQLARVLRVDKMTLAGLEKTLDVYLSDEKTAEQLPTIRDITKPLDKIHSQAVEFQSILTTLRSDYEVCLSKDTSQVGGGTMPGVELDTYVAEITVEGTSAQSLAAQLRNSTPKVITRIKENKVLIDFRTISDDEITELIEAFRSL
ncbi:L-seryl-tRNA(Sec) selenium transferase [Sediminibacillus massiliensis]|uniref:L-seryl-tRNA(Sec) selenium transferase n=1 Tax=Sediminibacillus massiliensis TaxID=1926277 RepID=UPI00098877A1|nr:L-seryl-tRNA(Sec) selenium transferase [Sediminibacillus massiliensis]